jgi:predicted CopG family antitoxin
LASKTILITPEAYEHLRKKCFEKNTKYKDYASKAILGWTE